MAAKKKAKKKAAKKKRILFSRSGRYCAYQSAPKRADDACIAYSLEIGDLANSVYDPHPAPIARSAKPKKGK